MICVGRCIDRVAKVADKNLCILYGFVLSSLFLENNSLNYNPNPVYVETALYCYVEH